MSVRNGIVTDKQVFILRALYSLPASPGDPVKPVNIGALYGRSRPSSPQWACTGLMWLIHYGLAVKLGRGSYAITPDGVYYLNNLA